MKESGWKWMAVSFLVITLPITEKDTLFFLLSSLTYSAAAFPFPQLTEVCAWVAICPSASILTHVPLEFFLLNFTVQCHSLDLVLWKLLSTLFSEIFLFTFYPQQLHKTPNTSKIFFSLKYTFSDIVLGSIKYLNCFPLLNSLYICLGKNQWKV